MLVMSILRFTVLLALVAPTASFAQAPQTPNIILPTVIVTAQKEAEDVKAVPASVTVVTATAMDLIPASAHRFYRVSIVY